MNWIDTIVGLIGGGLGSQGIMFLINKYRTPEQIKKDRTAVNIESIALGESAMILLNKQMEKLDKMSDRLSIVEDENKALKTENEDLHITINKMGVELGELKTKNFQLQKQIEELGKSAKKNVQRNFTHKPNS